MADKQSKTLRWVNATTGEIKDRRFAWREPIIWSEHAPSVLAGELQFRGEYDESEHTALELALQLVPDLVDIIDIARINGKSVTVRVEVEK